MLWSLTHFGGLIEVLAKAISILEIYLNKKFAEVREKFDIKGYMLLFSKFLIQIIL